MLLAIPEHQRFRENAGLDAPFVSSAFRPTWRSGVGGCRNKPSGAAVTFRHFTCWRNVVCGSLLAPPPRAMAARTLPRARDSLPGDKTPVTRRRTTLPHCLTCYAAARQIRRGRLPHWRCQHGTAGFCHCTRLQPLCGAAWCLPSFTLCFLYLPSLFPLHTYLARTP